MRKTAIDYSAYIMGVIGFLITIGNLAFDPKSNVTTSLLILSLITLLLVNYYLFKKWRKYSRYYEAYDKFNQAFAQTHKIDNPDIPEDNLDKDYATMKEFCSFVEQGFSLITNTQCAVCVKFLVYKNERAAVETFVRDELSDKKRPDLKKDNDNGVNHWLYKNTDFNYIFDEEQNEKLKNKFFFSNALPFEDFYFNSRIDDTKYPPKSKIPVIKEIKRYLAWRKIANLDYVSAIVVPIIPYSQTSLKENRMEGYLCLDSNSIWSFDAKKDIEIMLGIADGIYPAVRSIRKRHFSSEVNEA